MTNALFRPVTITFETLDRLTKEKKPADLIALYMSYAAIVQWQQTTTVKATTDFMATRLGWGRDKVIRTKKKLENLGLICSVARKDEKGKVTGHFVRVMYIITSEAQSTQKPEGGFVHTVDSKDTSTINKQISTTNPQSPKKQDLLLSLVNKITHRNFRTLPDRGVKKTLDAFTLEEIERALRAMAVDEWHKERMSKLSLPYFIRSTTIDRFLTDAEIPVSRAEIQAKSEAEAKQAMEDADRHIRELSE